MRNEGVELHRKKGYSRRSGGGNGAFVGLFVFLFVVSLAVKALQVLLPVICILAAAFGIYFLYQRFSDQNQKEQALLKILERPEPRPQVHRAKVPDQKASNEEIRVFEALNAFLPAYDAYLYERKRLDWMKQRMEAQSKLGCTLDISETQLKEQERTIKAAATRCRMQGLEEPGRGYQRPMELFWKLTGPLAPTKDPMLMLFFKTLPVYALVQQGQEVVYFTPWYLLFFDRDAISLTIVDYEALKVETKIETVVRDQYQSDDEVVRRSWQYERKDGGPDRRYRDNPCTTWVYRGKVLLSCNGLCWQLDFSNKTKAEAYAGAVKAFLEAEPVYFGTKDPEKEWKVPSLNREIRQPGDHEIVSDVKNSRRENSAQSFPAEADEMDNPERNRERNPRYKLAFSLSSLEERFLVKEETPLLPEDHNMGFSAIAERKKLVFLLNCYAERRMAEQKRLAEEEERKRQREEAKKKRDILKKQRRLAEEREREWQLKEAKRRRQEEAEQKRRLLEEQKRRAEEEKRKREEEAELKRQKEAERIRYLLKEQKHRAEVRERERQREEVKQKRLLEEQKCRVEEGEEKKQREEVEKKRRYLEKLRHRAEEEMEQKRLAEEEQKRQEKAKEKRLAEEEKRRRQRAEVARKSGVNRRKTKGQGPEETDPHQMTFQEMEERSKREIQEPPPATVESVPQKVYSPEELAREYRRLLSPGVILRHRRLGEGVLSRIENGYLYVRFHEEEKEKQFQYPQSVQNGYFTMIVPAKTEQADSSKGGASYDRN